MIQMPLLPCLLLVSSLLSVHPAQARPAEPQPIQGRSTEVQDGDTFVLLDDAGRALRIRVAGIDAPEKSQPYADRSRQHLRELLQDKRIRLAPIKQDVYGRTVARVYIPAGDADERDAALDQLQAGLAWHFKRYKSDQKKDEFVRYAQAEREARAAAVGLWQDPRPEAPWDFRDRKRKQNASGRTAAAEQRSGEASRP